MNKQHLTQFIRGWENGMPMILNSGRPGLMQRVNFPKKQEPPFTSTVKKFMKTCPYNRFGVALILVWMAETMGARESRTEPGALNYRQRAMMYYTGTFGSKNWI